MEKLLKGLLSEADKQEVDHQEALNGLFQYLATNRSEKVELPTVIDENQPTHNQAPLCWRRYNQYLACLNESEGDISSCAAFQYRAKATCPKAWIAEWREQREEGTFPGIQAELEDDGEDDDE